jgi:hypothetical protein
MGIRDYDSDKHDDEVRNEAIGELQDLMVYHPPNEDQVARFNTLRADLMNLGATILTQCPPGRERSLAITKLEEVRTWANASVARMNT